MCFVYDYHPDLIANREEILAFSLAKYEIVVTKIQI